MLRWIPCWAGVMSIGYLAGCGGQGPAGGGGHDATFEDTRDDLGGSDAPTEAASDVERSEGATGDHGQDGGVEGGASEDARDGTSDGTPSDDRQDGGFEDAVEGGASDGAVDAVRLDVAEAGGCAPPLQRCGELCVDLQSDPRHCGGCGMGCSAGQTCAMGACGCPPGTSLCGSGASARCVPTDSSTEHCGMCGRACAVGQSCERGMCVCPMGQALCGGVCVDTSATSEHCGACGNACPTGQRCVAGACVCPMGQTRCGAAASAVCVDTGSDTNHCGACGNTCPTGTTCSRGVCTCPPGQTLCGIGSSARCVDTLSDPNHCGACGDTCPTGQLCNAGRCAVMCAAPRTVCGTGAAMVCTDLQSDENHCGTCGHRCVLTPNAESTTCAAGACSLVCRAGYGNCDGNDANGCETDLSVGTTHCGACGNACASSLANAEAVTCGRHPRTLMPSCRPVCRGGFANCDEVDANGCEVDLRTDARHCGACGNVCAIGQTCVMGTCTAQSCRELRELGTRAGMVLPDGVYTIDPDGPAGALPPFRVFCDMGTDGGGWTLVLARQGIPYGESTIEGEVTVGSNRHLSMRQVMALAAVSRQVHIRNPGMAATRSITSIPEGLAIRNLRMGLVLNYNMGGVVANNAESQRNLEMHWSGPFAQAARLWFNCEVPPHGRAEPRWPAVYWACNNVNGLHLFNNTSSWVWTPGTGTREESMEVYVR